jgi:hypothetical protein
MFFIQSPYISNLHISSVEPGNEIIPPFETPVGRIGMLICFDVSFVS